MKRSALFIALLAATSFASAAPWTYRGTLNDGGKPANGAYDLRLTLVNEAGTASISQPITLSNVAVKDGNFAAEVDFGFDLTNAPALKLKTEVQQNGSGFASLGEPSAFDAKAALAGICWDTTGNVVAEGEFLGSTNNAPLVLKANNVDILRMSGGLTDGAANIVAGSPANTVAPSAFGQAISGGGSIANICGPLGTTPCRNTSSGNYATIGGGIANSAANRATVSGGSGNSAPGNSASVGGGNTNFASGNSASVGGGNTNSATGNSASVGGGSTNSATGLISSVGGGGFNLASGALSTIGGGDANTASGTASSVNGGTYNCAGGRDSWAGGNQAQVRPGSASGAPGIGCASVAINGVDGDAGTFVWADGQAPDFTSTGPNQFLIRAQGGMAINTNTPTAGAALTVAGGNVSVPAAALNFGATTRQMINLFEQAPTNFGIGVQSATLYNRVNATGGFAWFQGGSHNDAQNNPGTGGTVRMTLDAAGQLRTTTGTIATTSDARLKKNVSNYTGALDQISALRPVHYEYKDAGQSFQAPGQHLGFIAQEVQQVFPQWVLQGDDGYLQLSMRGFEAVAVRAMQELSVENTLLKTENATQNTEIAALNARLAALEAQLSK